MRIDRAKLAAEMARREWRYKLLSEMTGISSATLSAITGGKKVTEGTAQKIAQAFNMPLADLLEEV